MPIVKLQSPGAGVRLQYYPGSSSKPLGSTNSRVCARERSTQQPCSFSPCWCDPPYPFETNLTANSLALPRRRPPTPYNAHHVAGGRTSFVCAAPFGRRPAGGVPAPPASRPPPCHTPLRTKTKLEKRLLRAVGRSAFSYASSARRWQSLVSVRWQRLQCAVVRVLLPSRFVAGAGVAAVGLAVAGSQWLAALASHIAPRFTSMPRITLHLLSRSRGPVWTRHEVRSSEWAH